MTKYNLRYCDFCMQMTNHDKKTGKCMKCRAWHNWRDNEQDTN